MAPWEEVVQAWTLGMGQPKCQATKKEHVQHLACTFHCICCAKVQTCMLYTVKSQSD